MAMHSPYAKRLRPGPDARFPAGHRVQALVVLRQRIPRGAGRRPNGNNVLTHGHNALRVGAHRVFGYVRLVPTRRPKSLVANGFVYVDVEVVPPGRTTSIPTRTRKFGKHWASPQM